MESPNPENLLQRMVGHSNDSELYICGQKTNALVDTGSMVTCMSENFYNSLDPKPELRTLQDFQLNVYGAGGNMLPFSGYIEAELRIPFLKENSFYAPVLVRKFSNNDSNSQIPVIIGTNVIRSCQEMVSDIDNIPEVWNLAFRSMCSRDLKVKSSNHFPISIGPNEVKTIHGLVRRSYDFDTVVTEHTDTSQSGSLLVCPRVVSLRSRVGRVCRIPVRVCNLSTHAVKLLPKSVLCSVSPVKVLDAWSPETSTEKITTREGKSSDVFVENLGSKMNRQNLNTDEIERATNLLNRWKHTFSTSFSDIGRTDLVEHEIKLTDDVPVKEPYRRIPPGMYEEVRQHLKEMLEAGAIRKSQSSYCSNVVLARKSDGSLRFCLDLRKLNNKTIKDAYTLPRVDETMDTLIGSKYFSKLDLRTGYWQVEIKEQDKYKTAFSLGPLGFYECNRMAFGLTNAPATFQRLMENCMGELNLKECLIFLDDILIFSKTFENHLQSLERVFSNLHKHNLKLKPSKCEFFMTEVKYLGHIVSEHGIKTDPEKTKALETWPIPKNIKELRSFLGFTGYYRRFIKNYSRVVQPLNELLIGHSTGKRKDHRKVKKKVPWSWGEPQHNAFETLIKMLMTPPILSYADFSKPFILNIDASSEGLGAVLYQRQNGLERVIAYGSRGLRNSEKLYPAHKLEFLCLKWAVVDKFKDYLYNNTFEVRTDNNPLTYVTTSAKLDATGHRWLAALSNFNFKLCYRSGKSNQDADGLSRRPYRAEMFPDVVKAVYQAALIDRKQLPLAESLVITNTGRLTDGTPELESQELSTVNWQQVQDSDPVIGRLKMLLNSGDKVDCLEQESLDIRKYLRERRNFDLKKDVLVRNALIDGMDVQQIVLPESMTDMVLKGLHDDVGHQGREKTSWLVKQRFYWVGMDLDIRNKVEHCGRCIRSKTREQPRSELVNIVTSRPMELVCIDFLSLERSKGNIEDILVITDHFTKYAVAIPTRNQKALTTARALYEKFICYYGFPERIHSDQGRNFESRLIRELCNIAGVSKSRTTPYHPMGNGAVERFNQTLLKMLGTLEQYQKEDWKSYVPPLVQAYNATKQDTTGFSPHYLMFGWHPKLALDAYLGLDSVKEKDKHKENYVDKLKKRLDYAYKVARSNFEKNTGRYKRNYDFKVRNSKLEIGDRVLIRVLVKSGKSKLSDKWERDPYIVVDIPNPDIPVYKVQKESGKGAIRTLHRNLLLPFISISDNVDIESPKQPERKQQTKIRQRTKIPMTDSEVESSSNDDDDELTYMPVVSKKSGKENIPKGMPNTSSINHVNDLIESSGVSGINDTDISRGNSSTTQFDPSTVESDHGFHIHAGDLSNSGMSHNTNLSLPNVDVVSPDIENVNNVPRRSTRTRNKPDRYGDWVTGAQNVQVWYV